MTTDRVSGRKYGRHYSAIKFVIDSATAVIARRTLDVIMGGLQNKADKPLITANRDY